MQRCSVAAAVSCHLSLASSRQSHRCCRFPLIAPAKRSTSSDQDLHSPLFASAMRVAARLPPALLRLRALPSHSSATSPRVQRMSGLPFSSSVMRRGDVSTGSTTVSSPSATPSSSPFVLVYGGNGSLGQSMIAAFQAAEWQTISVDYFANSAADHNILLSHSNDWKTNTQAVTSSLDSIAASLSDELLAPAAASGTAYLAAVVAVAGGWKGSSISSPALFDSTDAMLAANVLSSLSSAHIAARYLLPHSLLLLTGAAAATSPAGTPSMIAYGLSKAAVHHLTLSLSSHDSELSARGIRVACLLPVTIDTPGNREVMRGADYADWTPTHEFAQHALRWAQQTEAGAARRREEKGKGEEGRGVRKQQREQDDDDGGERRVPHASGGERSVSGAAALPLVHGGLYEFRTSKGQTSVSLLDDPLALGQTVAQ